MDKGLFRAFKSVVVVPAGEAGYAKEKFLQSIRDRKRLKQLKRAVRQLQQEYPELFALERDWFETMLSMKKPVGQASRPIRGEPSGASFEMPDLSWGTVFAGLILVRFLLRLFTHLGSE